jgi:hypothetical protein
VQPWPIRQPTGELGGLNEQRNQPGGIDRKYLAFGEKAERILFGADHTSRLARVLEILDPRPYLYEAARISARFRGTGWLVAKAVTALRHDRQLWLGSGRDIGPALGFSRRNSGSRLASPADLTALLLR